MDTNRNVGISEGPERQGEEGLREGSRDICFCFRKLLLSGQTSKNKRRPGSCHRLSGVRGQESGQGGEV